MALSVRPRPLASLLGLLGVFSACGTEPVVVASVEVAPASVTLTALGDTRQLAAIARDARGAIIRGKTAGWSSAQPTVATVDAVTGLATAIVNGTTTINATVDGIAGQGTLTVAQAAGQLAFTAQPGTATAGEPPTPTALVEIRDARGNRVAGATDVVTIALGTNPTGAALGGTTAVGAVDGVADFADLFLQTAGSGYTLVASSGSLTAATSAAFEIRPAAPAQLVFKTPPSDAAAGSTVSPAVEVVIRDAYGNTATAALDAVNMAFGAAPSGATLLGTTTVVATAGVARFNDLSIRKAAEGYTLMASSGSLISATSPAFTILPGPPAALAFTGGPPSVVEGNRTIAPAVEVTVFDAFGNVAPSAGQVTLDLDGNPWAGPGSVGATLSGLVTAGVPSGVASFGSLRVDKPGAGYRLGARLGTLRVVSAPFSVALKFLSSAVATFHQCSMTAGGAYCWGDNVAGKLGGPTGTTFSDSVPLLVRGGLAFVSVSTGFEHSCGVTADGAAYCWGGNGRGELGTGGTANSETPILVAGGVTFASVSAGFLETCGITTAGAAYCWGANSHGQLGIGNDVDQAVPRPVAGGLSFSSLDLGIDFVCGVVAGGAVYCWGWNASGASGDGTTTDHNEPVQVSGSGTTLMFSSVSTGNAHTCGLVTTGAMYCWGVNGNGQLGTGSTTGSSVPVPVSGGVSFSALGAGGVHTCGLSGNSIYCWGGNLRGQLGDGTTTESHTPIPVSGGLALDRLDVGTESTCGRQAAGGTLFCWGRNDFGQLGDGSRIDRLTPTRAVQ